MTRPVQLQVNQSGAWRNVLSFDATGVPDEAFDHIDKFLRLTCRDKTTARVVMTRPAGSGSGTVATNIVLKRWTRPEGWVNT